MIGSKVITQVGTAAGSANCHHSFCCFQRRQLEASFTWKVREMQQMKNTILRNINRDITIRTQSDKCRVSRFSKSLKSLCSREHTTWKILPGGQTLLEFRLSQLKIDQGRHCQTGRSCSAVLAEYFYRRCEKEIAKFLALKNVVRG